MPRIPRPLALIPCLAAFFAVSAHAQSSLRLQAPRPWGFDVNRNLYVSAITFVSDTHWFACARQTRSILETTDAGAHWNVVFTAPQGNLPFASPVFTDETHAFITGLGDDTWRSQDGGHTWELIPQTAFPDYNEMSILSPTEFFTGGGAILQYTNDGGSTFVTKSHNPVCPVLFGLAFRDSQVGVVCGHRISPFNDSGIYRTSDGGVTWSLVMTHNTAFGTVNDIVWTDNHTLIGVDGTDIIQSLDEGQSWAPIFGGIFTGIVKLEKVPGTDVIVGVSFFGDVWRSADRGLTWQMTHTGIGDPLSPGGEWIRFWSADFGEIHGRDGDIFFSHDAGVTWQPIHNGIIDTIYKLDMVDDSTGFAVGNDMYALRTRDGGNQWDVQRLNVYNAAFGVDEYLRGVSAVDSQTAFLAGDSGIAFKTLDGGDTWQNMGYPVSNLHPQFYAQDIKFIDANTGWIVGSNLSEFSPQANVWKTADGGASWSTPFQPGGVVTSVDFKGLRGWIGANQAPFIYRTIDGGDNWTVTPIPDDVTISDAKVRFANMNTGWIVGFFGYLAKSTNGGATWVRINRPTQENYFDIKPVNVNEAYIIGAEGLTGFYLHTTNGGATWTRTNLPTFPEATSLTYCRTLDALSNGHFWLAGEAGQIWSNHPAALVPGDINADGTVNAADAAAFVNVLLNNDINPQHHSASDLNSDGVADGADIAAFVTTLVH